MKKSKTTIHLRILNIQQSNEASCEIDKTEVPLSSRTCCVSQTSASHRTRNISEKNQKFQLSSVQLSVNNHTDTSHIISDDVIKFCSMDWESNEQRSEQNFGRNDHEEQWHGTSQIGNFENWFSGNLVHELEKQTKCAERDSVMENVTPYILSVDNELENLFQYFNSTEMQKLYGVDEDLPLI